MRGKFAITTLVQHCATHRLPVREYHSRLASLSSQTMKHSPSLHEKTDGLAISRVHSFVLWLALSITYSITFVRRYSIPTWSDVLAKDFRADAAEFGTLSSGYWYAYSVLQMPSGIMLDLFNRHAAE